MYLHYLRPSLYEKDDSEKDPRAKS